MVIITTSSGDEEPLKMLGNSPPDNGRHDAAEEDDLEEEDGVEEDEEEEVGEVILGFAEKPEKLWSLLPQYFPSKAGGTPAWLNPVDLPSGKSVLCDTCEQPLQFLLQVYAPIAEGGLESTFHRTLFVFVCVSMSCLLRDQHEQWKRKPERPSRSVKVFRSQLPRINPFYSSEPPKADGTTTASRSGVPLCSWCGTWGGDKVCTGCKSARYCSQKHQGMHWRSSHKVNCVVPSLPSPANCGLTKRSTISVERVKPGSNTLWPEYELEQAAESEFEVMSDNGSHANTSLSTKNRDDKSLSSLMDIFQADDERKCWASFQERMATAPEQVLRYCRTDGAKPLWPMLSGRPSKADIPNCSYCGGSLKFECQIMPQLLYYFRVKDDVDSLDWATIVLYACEASCDVGGAYAEEFAWVQMYPR